MVFLVIPELKNVAKAYVCIDKDINAACRDIQAANLGQAKSVCNLDVQVPVKGKCGVSATSTYSCIDSDGNCVRENILANSLEEARPKCGSYIAISRATCPLRSRS